MSMKSYPFRHLSANLSVKPCPSSLVESAAVLRKLTSFGQVTAFKKMGFSPHDTTAQGYKVLFASTKGLSEAVSASPFTVVVGSDLPDPQIADPYDVYGLQSRKPPNPTSLECEVARDENPEEHVDLAKQNLFHGSYWADKRMLHNQMYKPLLHTHTPPGLLEAFCTPQTVVGALSLSEDNGDRKPAPEPVSAAAGEGAREFWQQHHQEQEQHPPPEQSIKSRMPPKSNELKASHFFPERAPDLAAPPKLMDMYRESAQRTNRKSQTPAPKPLIPAAIYPPE